MQHVWTAPPCKKFFDAALPNWSGAVVCPAFVCGA
jgi:hypothetical protein